MQIRNPKMKKLFLLLTIIGLSACSQKAYFTSSDIQYVQDHRTGLCFAMVIDHQSMNKIGMTTVDCNDVEDLLNSETDTVVAKKPIDIKPAQSIARFYRNKPFSTF